MTARLSIVVPAHNEGPLVRASLTRMLSDAEPGEFEVIVAANGCSDDTVEQAARVEGVTIVETSTASKIAGLNLGDRAATVFPRAYLDADVAIPTSSLRRMASELADDRYPLVCAPTLVVDASASTFSVRAHTRVWALSEYRQQGHIGSGVYAVSAAGRARWGDFPEVIADDRYVQLQFAAHERRTLTGAHFTVRAPRDMSSLVRRGTRIELGNRQLAQSDTASSAQYGRLLKRVARTPSSWASFPFYVYGYAAPKIRSRSARDRPIAWNRDEASRQDART